MLITMFSRCRSLAVWPKLGDFVVEKAWNEGGNPWEGGRRHLEEGKNSNAGASFV